MVYRGLDIGTAKPDPEVLASTRTLWWTFAIPASLIPPQILSRRGRAGGGAWDAGRLPLLVAARCFTCVRFATGLPSCRRRTRPCARRLPAMPSASAGRLCTSGCAGSIPRPRRAFHPGNPQRLQRALEVWMLTGNRFPSGGATQRPECPRASGLRAIEHAIVPDDRAVLHARIAARFDVMLERGLVAEVAKLHERGDLDPSLPAIARGRLPAGLGAP